MEAENKGCTSCLAVLIVFGLFSCGMCSVLLVTTETEPWDESDNSIAAYVMTEGWVKDRLRAPSTAKFPGVFEGRHDHVKHLGNRKYRIRSYVDAENVFGARVRTHFDAEVEQVSEDRWRLLSLEMLE